MRPVNAPALLRQWPARKAYHFNALLLLLLVRLVHRVLPAQLEDQVVARLAVVRHVIHADLLELVVRDN